MEIWCIHSISKLYNEINDAKQAVENYKKAIPLLIEAQKTIVMICTASEQNINDEHLQKLTFNRKTNIFYKRNTIQFSDCRYLLGSSMELLINGRSSE